MKHQKITVILSGIIIVIMIGLVFVNLEILKEKYLIFFNQSGTIFYYNKFGQLDGEIDVILDGKVIKKENFKNGKFDGWTSEYYLNGVVKKNIHYRNNKADGIESEYYLNGKIKSKKTYKDGKSEGIRERFYPNGSIENKSFCKNDKSEGMEKEYYENGNLQYERNWIDNKIYGDFYYYYENGKVKVYHAYDILGNKFYIGRYDQWGQFLISDGYVFSPHIYSRDKVNNSIKVLNDNSSYESINDLYVTIANPRQISAEIKVTINNTICKNLEFLDNNTVKISNAFLNKGKYSLLINGRFLDKSNAISRSSTLKMTIIKG